MKDDPDLARVREYDLELAKMMNYDPILPGATRHEAHALDINKENSFFFPFSFFFHQRN